MRTTPTAWDLMPDGGFTVSRPQGGAYYFGRGATLGMKSFKLVEIGRLILAGSSDRAIERQLGVAQKTVSKLRRILWSSRPDAMRAVRCECGHPPWHTGVCVARRKGETP